MGVANTLGKEMFIVRNFRHHCLAHDDAGWADAQVMLMMLMVNYSGNLVRRVYHTFGL